ncbi:MAG: hydantoinase/oxoprolinase family protein [Pseudomonadota bacterium]|nr:hydantoinase/oxoprolinase family protein [Pseudomonadota bacterium]
MNNKKRDLKYIVATDVGGTCTDTIIISERDGVQIGKALSTPPNFANGVMDSIQVAADEMKLSIEELFEQTYLFMHGSTVVDNTLLTRGGSTTGLITTAGFEDTLLVTRGAYGRWAGQPEEWIKHPVITDRPPALVKPDAIYGVLERTDYKGENLLPVDDAEVERVVHSLVQNKQVDAIAVCFLWSFYNDENERRVGDIIKRVSPEIYVSLSSEIAPIVGEYERTSTTVINAYAGGLARAYVTNLRTLLEEHGYRGPLMVMQGYGGLLPSDEAANRAVGMIECGPAAGVIGAKALGDLLGDQDIIAADMGGTTFKVGVIQDGEIEFAREPMVDRYHYVAPKIEVVSIGAGGGSIVTVDERTGAPKVGPRSAGADPGPICYGRGGREITLTDVFTLVGYMDPDSFLGGAMTLDISAAREKFQTQIAEPLGLSIEEAAFGIFRVAAAQITDLIHEITVERGLDPREFVLHAFGGSCPILASMFGAELNVKRIVVPSTASVNCAFGLVSANIVHEYSTTATLPSDTDPDTINELFEPMVAKALKQLKSEGFSGNDVRLDWSVDLRYARQVHEVTTAVNGKVPMDPATLLQLINDFESLYERKYGKGSAYREAGIEMTMFRLSASGLLKRPELDVEKLEESDPSKARMGHRKIFVDARDGMADADIYDFNKLHAGNTIVGPAVIHTPITTIVLQDKQRANMDEYRNIIIALD